MNWSLSGPGEQTHNGTAVCPTAQEASALRGIQISGSNSYSVLHAIKKVASQIAFRSAQVFRITHIPITLRGRVLRGETQILSRREVKDAGERRPGNRHDVIDQIIGNSGEIYHLCNSATG